MDWRIFCILLKILSFKMFYLIHEKQRLLWRRVFQPWFLSWNAKTSYRVIWSTTSYPAKYKLILFWSGHFGPDMEKIKQLSECFKHRNTFGNIGNAVKVLVGTQSTRENLRPWTKARLTGDVFEVFGIIVVVGITRVIYFQFLEYEGYYLTKNWFVRASLGYLNE